MTEKTIYEQPLNERIRTFLRLEFLFARFDMALQGQDEMHHREAVDAILSVLAVFDRSDLRMEISKEIERLISNLSALENSPGVDKAMLDDLLDELDQTLDALSINKTPIGQPLRESDFLYSIRQRSSIAGGTCAFDIPAFHYWLSHVDTQQREQQLRDWMEAFVAVRAAVEIALRLIRSATYFEEVTAEDGFFQRSLDGNQPTQLIRVQIPQDSDYFPEISGGKHRFTVRFMIFDLHQRAQQKHADIPFQLSCCAM